MTNNEAINLLRGLEQSLDGYCELNDEGKKAFNMAVSALELFGNAEQLPSAQTTLYGYNIEHLKLIAEVLRKENLSPERVVEALTDIGRIASIVRAEFEEELKKAVERCMI